MEKIVTHNDVETAFYAVQHHFGEYGVVGGSRLTCLEHEEAVDRAHCEP